MQAFNKIEREITPVKNFFDNLKDWWKYLKQYAIKGLLVGILGGGLGFLFAYIQPTKYLAKISFILEEGKNSTSGFGGLASLAGQFGLDVGNATGGGILSGDNILLYFKSPTLAREVLLAKYNDSSNATLADVYAETYKLAKRWEKDNKIGKISFPPNSKFQYYSRLQDSLLQSMVKYILENQFTVARTDKKAGFIDVTITLENENLAKRYCEEIVQTVVEKYINIKTERQKTTVDNLQKRVDSISNILKAKTFSGAALQNTTSTMDINPLYKTKTNVAVETTIRDKTLLATIFASVTQNLEIAKFTLSQETPVIQIVDAPIFPLKTEKPSKSKSAILASFILLFVYFSYLIVKRFYQISMKYNA